MNRRRAVVAGRGGARARPRCEGQATVELVLLLPVVALLALVVVHVALVARASLLVAHAAREGARAAAVEPDAGAAAVAARAAAVRASTLDPARVQVEVRVDADDVVVVVRYDDPTDLPLLGGLVRGVRLQERASMRREGP